MSGRVIVLRGDAAHLPLPDRSVDLVVTSPPYFGLRSYADGGEHYSGQIGSEATPQEWLAAMLECTAEWVRVLKPSGSIFVNLGDKYSGAAGPGTRLNGNHHPKHVGDPQPRGTAVQQTREKSLLGLPWRYALACMDDLGLTLRAEIVWAKPNGLPESVTDRVRRSHEQVFHFTRQPRYYAAVDEIRESYSDNPRAAWNRANGFAQNTAHASDAHNSTIRGRDGKRDAYENPLGKLPGSVWEIPSAPLVVPPELGVDHFAAYPPELCRRIILAWSPPQGLVADPFGGTGTTTLVASVLGRDGVTVDMSADYCRLAQWRTHDPAERCRVIGAPKPPPVADGQGDLFDLGKAS